MRQIVLDTETTGLEPRGGHRIIEIGCVEIIDRKLTGRHYHQYINPQRDIDEGAQEVHGITLDFLSDKPVFDKVVREFVQFIDGAELVIHNASFDIGFMDHEFALCGFKKKTASMCSVIDTLALARNRHPGQKNNLNALCKRYGVDNSQRDLHGALLDAEILADVYLLMTGGQTKLSLGAEADDDGGLQVFEHKPVVERPVGRVIMPTDTELAAHEAQLDIINKVSNGSCVWRQAKESPSSVKQ